MTEFIVEQLSLSTAYDEANYFTGQPEVPWRPDPNEILRPGTYRVIDGQLYRVVGGMAPTKPQTESDPRRTTELERSIG